MDAGAQEVGRVSVPQVMKSNAREAFRGGQANPLVGDRSGLQRPTVRLSNHERITIRPQAQPQELLGLGNAPGVQFLDNCRRQADFPAFA